MYTNVQFVSQMSSHSNVYYCEGSTALHMAIDGWTDNRLCVQALVDNGAALDVKDVHGRTPLHIASIRGHHRLIKLLAPSPESFHFKDNDGCTPLYYACKNSHLKCIRKLFAQIPDVIGDLLKVANNEGTTPLSVRRGSGRTILHVACAKGETDLVQKLLEAGADPNVTDKSGYTPLSVRTGSGGTILHVACEIGDIFLVKKLLEAGADPNVTDEFGFTPLMRAVVSTSKSGITTEVVYSIITALCNSKCNVNASFVPSKPFDSNVHYYKGSTALHMAIDEWTDNQLCVQVLVDNGAALDARDVHGRTPLHFACLVGYHCFICSLDPKQLSFLSIKDNNGCTPLYYACKNSHLECIQAFIDQCPDIMGYLMKIANNHGTTPLSVRTGSGGTILHVACEKGDINLVKKLLEAGADPNVTDEFGFTPLMRAVVSTSKSGITTDVVSFFIITALCSSKCNVNASFVPSKPSNSNVHYNEGSTALHMAIDGWTYNRLCVQALVDNGAALDARDVHGRTPLHIASMWGHHHLIKLLAPSPETFHFKDNDGCTPLYYVCKNSHLEFIRTFIVQIPDIIGDLIKVANNYGTTPLSVRTNSGGTILHVACDKGDINLVKKLLEAGADPNITDEFGFTPLMRAVVSTSKSGITTDVASSIITALSNSKCNVNASFVPSKPSNSNVHYNEGSTALHMAIDEWTDNRLCVQALVDNGAALDARDVHGHTPLHIACLIGYQYLIGSLDTEQISFLSIKDNNGCTPLYYACKNSHLECIQAFIVQYPDVVNDLMKLANNDGTTPLSVRTGSGGTILHVACGMGDIYLLKKLLEAGADPNVTDKFGFTPLMRAVLNTSVSDTDVSSIVTILCNSNWHVNSAFSFISCKSSDKYILWKGITALHMAVGRMDCCFLCVKALIDNGATVDVRDTQGRTPLHIASIRGHFRLIRLLAPSPESFHFKDNDGSTPLYYACKNSHLECIEEFMVIIPDVVSDLMKVANKFGATPLSVRALNDQTILHVACKKGNLPIVKKLLETGVDPNSRDGSTFTPLMLAVQHVDDVEAADIVAMLCEFKCKINIQTSPFSRSVTALHLACELGKEKCVEMLIAKGANVLVRTQSGLTPLHLACEGGYHTLISSLITKETLRAYDYTLDTSSLCLLV